MEQRKLGRSKWSVGVIGLGAWQLGADSGDVNEAVALATLNGAVDAGVTFIDTADVYGDGRSERLIGQLLQQRPDCELFVATKMGRRAPQMAENFNRASFREWTDRSRKSLRVALLMERGVPGPLAALAVLAIAALIGLVNGVCIAMLRMTSLIETLAMGLALGGGVLALTKGRAITISDQSYTWIGQGQIFGWPIMPAALVLLFAVIGVVLYRTPWGRKIYATGGNARAAYAAGINTRRLIIETYVLGGFLAGCAGWLATSYLSGVNSTMGSDLLLYAVAPPVIGGVSLTGGRGRVLGMLGGVLLLTVIQVGLQHRCLLHLDGRRSHDLPRGRRRRHPRPSPPPDAALGG